MALSVSDVALTKIRSGTDGRGSALLELDPGSWQPEQRMRLTELVVADSFNGVMTEGKEEGYALALGVLHSAVHGKNPVAGQTFLTDLGECFQTQFTLAMSSLSTQPRIKEHLQRGLVFLARLRQHALIPETVVKDMLRSLIDSQDPNTQSAELELFCDLVENVIKFVTMPETARREFLRQFQAAMEAKLRAGGIDTRVAARLQTLLAQSKPRSSSSVTSPASQQPDSDSTSAAAAAASNADTNNTNTNNNENNNDPTAIGIAALKAFTRLNMDNISDVIRELRALNLHTVGDGVLRVVAEALTRAVFEKQIPSEQTMMWAKLMFGQNMYDYMRSPLRGSCTSVVAAKQASGDVAGLRCLFDFIANLSKYEIVYKVTVDEVAASLLRVPRIGPKSAAEVSAFCLFATCMKRVLDDKERATFLNRYEKGIANIMEHGSFPQLMELITTFNNNTDQNPSVVSLQQVQQQQPQPLPQQQPQPQPQIDSVRQALAIVSELNDNNFDESRSKLQALNLDSCSDADLDRFISGVVSIAVDGV